MFMHISQIKVTLSSDNPGLGKAPREHDWNKVNMAKSAVPAWFNLKPISNPTTPCCISQSNRKSFKASGPLSKERLVKVYIYTSWNPQVQKPSCFQTILKPKGNPHGTKDYKLPSSMNISMSLFSGLSPSSTTILRPKMVFFLMLCSCLTFIHV